MKTLARTALERTLDECKRHIEMLEENQDTLLAALAETNLRVIYILKSVTVKMTVGHSSLAIAPEIKTGTLESFYKEQRHAFEQRLATERAAREQPSAGEVSPEGRVVAIDAAQLTRHTH